MRSNVERIHTKVDEMSAWDCIVIGTGGVGSAALYHAAGRGVRVLGLDRFPPGHDRGSSHGETRIIRQAYFEHPDYVPLSLRSYELWAELEARSGASLYRETGLLQVGPRDGQVVRGVLESARRHGLDVEKLDAAEAERRFPGFALPGALAGVYERRAGFLRVEACVATHIEQARALGAETRHDVTVHSWTARDGGVTVETDHGTFHAARLIVTCGAWSSRLLADLGLALDVLRKPLFWYRARAGAYDVERGAPGFLFELPRDGGADVFYGFPAIDGEVKFAEHSGGRTVDDPLAVDRELDAEDRRRVEAFAEAHLPLLTGELTRHAVCMYTMTPDAHFIVDGHPAHANIAFAAGLSGHGFKFTPALGEALVELVFEGRARAPVGFLGSARFARG